MVFYQYHRGLFSLLISGQQFWEKTEYNKASSGFLNTMFDIEVSRILAYLGVSRSESVMRKRQAAKRIGPVYRNNCHIPLTTWQVVSGILKG
jgi:hypothetical protein